MHKRNELYIVQERLFIYPNPIWRITVICVFLIAAAYNA